ncbi:MAG: molybdopterin cofactor-binding domain-containing protein [Pseudomonadota bacterium]
MNEHIKDTGLQVSRRSFVKSASGLTFSFALTGALLGRPLEAFAAEGAKLNAWVTIGADNTITILCPTSEMGQGVLTSLPLMLAEELDADWSKVKCEFAPGNPKLYGGVHKMFPGAQVTLASVSTPAYYIPLRTAGAQARKVLLDAVAEEWKVPVAELTTDKSVISHKKSKRTISYGDVVKFAKVPAEPPKIAEADLKKPKDFKLIGRKDIKRVDVPSKVNGSAKYGIDVQVPGMVYASLLHAPMDGVKVESVNADDIKKIKGVTHVLSLPFGVAVVADTVEASRAGRMALKVKWDTKEAKAAPFDSEKAKADYERKAKDPASEVKEAFKVGDADKAMAGAKQTLEAAYWSEHTYHAQMEPMNAVAKVDGDQVEIWVGTQVQPLASAVVANVLKTTPDKVKINLQLLGGGFGRRIWPDAPVQAAVLANIVKKPVKLMLTREDDIAAARPRPMTYHVMKAGLDDKKNLVSWHHRIVAENVDAVAAPPRFQATQGRDYIGWVGMSQEFYNIPNLKADAIREIRGMRVHAWRGIGAGYNKFVSESFLDEVAAARGVDPLAYRLELTKDHPRAQAVLKAVAEMSNYKKKRPGRGMGIAFSDYHDTLTAGVAEVSVDKATGKIKVHNYWIAVDPGLVVQPENAQAQVESAIVYGLSGALSEELTMKDGAVQQSNFNDYHVLRMSDMPELHVKIMPTDNPPTGMGEVGIPTVAPAIGNAVAQLTGKRLRHLPMSSDRVKKALA